MNMMLTIDGMDDIPIGTNADFAELLKPVNGRDSSFAILAKSDQTYIRTHCDGIEYVLEKREGHESAHYSAIKQQNIIPISKPKKWWQFWKRVGRQEKFSFDVIVDQFSSYAFGSTPKTQIGWSKMEMVK